MSRQGQVVLRRMRDVIVQYRAGRIGLRPLVDDLKAMHDALPAEEELPDRAWRDAFVPLDRIAVEEGGPDREELERRVLRHLGQLESLLGR
ncbi:MAG TPA: hypothetical protein VJV23_02910 [Candidatus Polarisedimenticolia bacterium]|nr:hypothetical protein [Candidatus Polarisedimenticolia bacterium]